MYKNECDTVVEKRVVRLTLAASYGEFIDHNDTDAYTWQHARKFPMTLVCEIFLYLLILFCVYVAQTQSLSGTCFSRMLLPLHHCLDCVHSGPKQYVVQAVSRPCSPYIIRGCAGGATKCLAVMKMCLNPVSGWLRLKKHRCLTGVLTNAATPVTVLWL